MKGTPGVAALVIMAALAGCNHQRVKSINDVPAPVRATFEKEAAGGTVGDIQKRQKNGKPYYLAEILDKDGKWWDVSVAEDGKVLGKD